MPEIKNTFIQGKMNKDLDERLLPNGQYRDAKNVEVSTSEDSNVGVVKNVLGNYRVEDIVDTTVFTCVGSIANEKANKIYWFISSYEKDAIIEHDIINNITLPVLVDTNAGNFKAVLKFSGNIITGINIIDNLLFWTDNNSEPKKINIDTCKKGTVDMNTHTQLEFENGSFNGLTVQLTSASSTTPSYQNTGKYFWFEQKQLEKILLPFGPISDQPLTYAEGGYDDTNDPFQGSDPYLVRHYRNSEFLGLKHIRIFDAGNGTHARLEPLTDATNKDWHVGDTIFGDNIKVDIEERHITVIKPKPLNTLSIKINHSNSATDTSNIPNLFETKFPRFSYRYKYRDGEYSAFAPFTTPVFNPKYPKDPSLSFDTDVFYNQDNIYSIKEPYNKAMINSIHSVELSDFITNRTPEDVVEIDVLYKQEESSVIYSIGTIKHVDSEWHNSSNHEGLNFNIGIGKADNNTGDGQFYALGGFTKGKYIVTTENIYAALPANQLLRPWDNVPKKALAQEITGNRIVYGNYVQNYDLINNTEVSVSYNARKNNINTFITHGLPSIKSQRNYQLGIIYSDKYGRETPVLTSRDGAINIPWQDSSGNKNASKSNQLSISVANNFPEWVDSLKFFVKETSNEYYNLTMDRAWVTKSTYDLDNSEGHIWISFPSSDRNKISEDNYIVLKKKIGVGQGQVSFENKYKVIDIKNEAPEALKYELNTYGSAINGGLWADSFTKNNAGGLGSAMFGFAEEFWPSYYDVNAGRGTNKLKIHIDTWDAKEINIPLENHPEATTTDPILSKNLYVSWFRNTANGISMSNRYKVIGGKIDSVSYVLQLEDYISKIDADIAHVISDASQTAQPTTGPFALGGASPANPATEMFDGLVFQIEKKERKDLEDFSGKFFVKISKNQVTDLITDNQEVSILDQYQVKANNSSWYWEDNISDEIDPTNANYGIANHSGHPQTPTSDDSIRHQDNNNSSGAVLTDADGNHAQLLITDYTDPWECILDEFGATFFVDSMYMAAGQSDVSNYAKYCCVTWASTNDDDTNPEDSAWSYPPLKTWLGEFEDTSGVIETLEGNSVWYNNDLISTSEVLTENPDWNDSKVDGWVGPLQKVSRYERDIADSPEEVHINGLEGFVTTDDMHAIGARRWFSGITGNPTEHGVGIDTRTYSTDGDTGRHFMHLSFFAPGKDLHSGFTGDNNIPANVNGSGLYGQDGWMNYLQGIWGGGVFTGENINERFGSGTEKHIHLAMEGNYDGNNLALPEVPGPGVGYGYDINYRELHERQWDPTFSNVDNETQKRIRDFIKNLHPGAKFRFHKVNPANDDYGEDIDTTVYTIKNVRIKKLYNHTSWRKTYNRYNGANSTYQDTQSLSYKSVEEVGLEWLNQLDDAGQGTNSNNEVGNFKDKIVEFGKAHNRRVCYIVELDKNPVDSSTSFGNPIGDVDIMSANHDSDKYCDIEFLDEVVSPLLSDLSKFPAIWEVDPKKKEVDLDIYYEASSNIPVRLNGETNELFAPIGCKVEVLNSNITSSSILESWNNEIATFYPGFEKASDNVEINYTGMLFKFIREDGSYTIAEACEQSLDGGVIGFKTEFAFREEISDNITAGLSWYNCFSFGNGLESNRIKDDFNEVFITNGVKASTTTQETYKEERRAHGLIYSGLYNSNSGINDLNQFIMAEKITKDLNPTYGSIQKLFSRNTDLITFCEDKVIKVLANKDAVFNADGNTQLTATENVLGQTVPFVGDYGISKNPESFASESYRAYFADKQRGAVLRLSRDGLTPISNTGMNDWFRDNLSEYNSLIGTYDNYKEDYNLTLVNNSSFFENLLSDTYLKTGDELSTLTIGADNRINNPAVNNGTALEYLYEPTAYNVIEYANAGTNPFDWNAFTIDDYNFKSSVTVTHHAAMTVGDLQPEVTADSVVITTPAVQFSHAEFELYSHSALPDDGWFYDPDFADVNSYTTEIFGTAAYNARSTAGAMHYDNQAYSYVHRRVDGVDVDESDPTSHPAYINWTTNYGNNAIPSQYLPTVSKDVHLSGFAIGMNIDANWINNVDSSTGMITRNSGGEDGQEGVIAFDRVSDPLNSYVEFRDIGRKGYGDATYDLDGGLMDQYSTYPQTPAAERHRAFYNGDELHVQVHLRCYATAGAFNSVIGSSVAGGDLKGYNVIRPTIKLMDGANTIDDSAIRNVFWAGTSAQYAAQQANSTPFPDYHNNYQTQMHSFGAYDGVGADYAYQVTGFSSVSDLSNTSNTDWDFVDNDYCNKRFNTSNYAGTATVEFPSTESIAALDWDSRWTAGGTSEAETVVLNVSFKFQDYNGNPYSTVSNNNGTSNNQIVDVKVVDDLRIRIFNSEPVSDQSFNYDVVQWGPGNNDQAIIDSSNGDRVLHNQYWEIKRLKIKKGLGITAPYTPATAEVTSGVNRAAVDAVPPENIPAWTEITYNGNYGFPNNSWSIDYDAYNNPNVFGNGVRTHAQGPSQYGTNYSAIPQVGLKQNADISLPPTQNIHYVVPQDWGFGSSDHTILNNNALGNSPSIVGSNTVAGASFDRTTNLGDLTGDYNAHKIVQDHNNAYIHFQQDTGADASDIIFSLGATEAWETNTWYLVDIEWDQTYGAGANFGNGSSDGTVHVVGVADHSGMPGAAGTEIDSNGVGNYSGGNTNAHVRLIQSSRTEYGAPGTVLRGIFQVHPNSWRMDPVYPIRKETFRLRVYGCTTGVKIEKIITKKLSNDAGGVWNNWFNEAGTADNWNLENGSGNADQVVHAFDDKKLYFKNSSLNWDVPAGSGSIDILNNDSYKWDQTFSFPPVINSSPWELSFNVSGIVLSGGQTIPMSGMLRGFVAIDDGTGTGTPQGMYFYDIVEEGRYKFRFTFNNSEVGTMTDLSGNVENIWRVLKAPLGTNNYAVPVVNAPTHEAQHWNTAPPYNHMINKVWFSTGDDSVDSRFRINNIQLINGVSVFTGGSAGSWNFDGFNTSVNDYIFWKIDPSANVEDGYLVFNSCPAFEVGESKFINVNQQIDDTVIQYSQYKIRFTHDIDPNSVATLSVYYYNTNGFGFKITDINENSWVYNGVTYNTVPDNNNYQVVEQVVTIGDSEWSPVNELDSTFNPNLKNSFVIEVQGDSGDIITGSIDNIEMLPVFSNFVQPLPTTITFNENVKGWVSFKDFIPENGVSIAKQYFTFYKGGLYQHYVPLKKDNNGDWVSGYIDVNTGDFAEHTAEEAENYNRFYNVNTYHSSIKAVLNQEPSLIKTFNTINYEGSQAHIIKPTNNILPNGESAITIDNAVAYSSGNDILGWSCSEIKTNSDKGSIQEFIEKEGKWFNYIKGSHMDPSDIDTSLFSVQGIGVITGVQDI